MYKHLLLSFCIGILGACGGPSGDETSEPTQNPLPEGPAWIMESLDAPAGARGADGISESNGAYIIPWQESGHIRVCDTNMECWTEGFVANAEWALLGPGASAIGLGKEIIDLSTGQIFDIPNSGTFAAGAVFGNWLIAGSQSGQFAIFDIESGDILFQSQHRDTIMEIQIVEARIYVFDRQEVGYYDLDLRWHSLYLDNPNALRMGHADPSRVLIARAHPPAVIEVDARGAVVFPVPGSGAAPKDIAPADLDGDGREDFVLSGVDLSGAKSTLYYLSNKEDFRPIFSGYKKADNILIRDVNGDGRPDILTTYEKPNLGFVAAINPG